MTTLHLVLDKKDDFGSGDWVGGKGGVGCLEELFVDLEPSTIVLKGFAIAGHLFGYLSDIGKGLVSELGF